MTEALDRRFTAAAIRLGASALGTTWPNPAVGAILVKDGRVVGRGRTARGGRPHAETQALAMAGGEARGATLYVSLEPCAHHGKTPPCADAVVEAGVARVVAPIADPDPRVGGKGLEHLTAAGIEVMRGTLAQEAKRAQAGYLRRTEQKRPYVLLKLAVSADDAVARAGEAQVAVTGPIARRHVQALRSRFDAILVGRGTVEADDPQLTCRLPGLEARSPVRVVLDSDGTLDAARRVFNDAAPTWHFIADEKQAAATSDHLRIAVARTDASGLDLASVLNRLAEEGISAVLVEGGAQVARSFLEADLVDDVMLFRSPQALGGDLVQALAGLPLLFIEASDRFRRIDRRRFGADKMTLYERVS
jgi:diaminohydroxyphosphoribosylaminopyrimidine deaminase/5-amino-6-(5-phosphoribosylamino)uracil reductase